MPTSAGQVWSSPLPLTLTRDAACRAGGSIIHPHNLYVRYFANLLGLVVKAGDDDD
jgi:hypothetical protein